MVGTSRFLGGGVSLSSVREQLTVFWQSRTKCGREEAPARGAVQTPSLTFRKPLLRTPGTVRGLWASPAPSSF